MADYLVGARRICVSCRERGLHVACARCGETTLDLADAADRSRLDQRWSGGRPLSAGLGLWSLRNVLVARRLRNATVLTTIVVLVGAGIGATQKGGLNSSGAMVGVLLGIAIGGLLAAPFLGFFFLVYANVVRILGLIVEIVLPLASAAPRLIRGSLRVRFNILRTLLWWIESALLPRIDIAPVPTATGPERTGALIDALTLSILIDESGWLWCTDAVVPPFALRTNDEETPRLDVRLDVGAVKIPLRLGARVQTPGESAAWLTPPPRGRRFQRILPAGTPVKLSGGERGEALCGTPRSPLIAVFGEGA